VQGSTGAEELGSRAREHGCGGEKGELSIVRSCVAAGLAPVIPAKAGIQSNNGCIQIVPILWIPDQVRHDGTHFVIPANPGSGSRLRVRRQLADRS